MHITLLHVYNLLYYLFAAVYFYDYLLRGRDALMLFNLFTSNELFNKTFYYSLIIHH